MNQVKSDSLNSDKIIRVLVVDDSAFIRVLLTEILESCKNIQVVATAEDPIDARDKIKKYAPDVITLDVEMPKMDGITFLKNIMRLRPMPVIMVSTLTQTGADITLEALEFGAFDFIGKPSSDVKNRLTDLADDLINKVIAAANCNKLALEKREYKSTVSSDTVSNYPFKLITIGASTGGTEAIREVIRQLPLGLPPIVMSQHIPATFSTSYAKRLNRESIINVREIQSSTRLESGYAYLAPGSHHLLVKKKDGHFWAVLDDGEKVNRHKPSVDVMFNSIVDLGVKDCLGIVLTGMGKDGAKGLKALKDIGATTFVQDEESSVVWGMPGASVKEGGVDRILPLGDIAQAIVLGK